MSDVQTKLKALGYKTLNEAPEKIRDSINRSNIGAIDFSDSPSLTRQEFAEESNVNNIMKKFERTGVIEHLNRALPQFGDFSEVTDFQTAFDIVRDAERMFSALPSAIRARFNNDPGQFLAFVQDPANQAAMVEMGLAKQPDPPAIPPDANAAPSAARAPAEALKPPA